MLVYGIAVPVLPRFPAVAAGGGAATGALFAEYAAALVLVTPLAGRWVDARGPRIPMLVGLVVLAVATSAFATVEPLGALVLARAAQGAGVIAAIEPVLPRHLASQGQGPIATGLVFGAAVLASAFVTPAAGALTRRARISVLAGGAAAVAVAGLLVLAAGDGQGPAVSGRLVEGIGFGPAIGMLAALIAVGAGTASLLMARRFEKA